MMLWKFEKSNIIMVGYTGTGKNPVGKNDCQKIACPFYHCRRYGAYRSRLCGEDIESILTRLLQVADYDVRSCRTWHCFIDEIDKIARKGDNPSITRDVSGEGVTTGLLQIARRCSCKCSTARRT
jgi:ATP-dependent Clp protease ATP-binding subunit ClpX